MIKVSIVVPIYNVEKYLPKCVQSIQNQTLKDIEIILVDDESPDNCPQMIDKYAKEDSRIVNIHQKNKWLGGARNAGLKVAKGEYITWVDSDDFIREDYCEKLYNFAKQYNCDIVLPCVYNLNSMDEIESISSKKYYFDESHILDKKQINERIYNILIKSYDFNVCRGFIKKTIVDKGFLFDEKIRYAEDYEAALRVYKIAESVGYLDEPLYYYRQNDESIMHVVKFERLKQIIFLFELREKFIAENNLGTAENLFNSAHLLIKLFIEKFPLVFGIKGKKYSTKKAEIKEILNDNNLRTAMSRIRLKNLNMGVFGKICLFAMKIKCPLLIIAVSSIYNKRTP